MPNAKTEKYQINFGWRLEWCYEWEQVTKELKKYDLSHILLVSTENSGNRQKGELNNGTNKRIQ